jgi:ABC-2 type transport system permease protein
MIASIKAEWRKLRFRPAFSVSAGLIAGITVLFYSLNWYQALHPGARDRGGVVSILTLFPDQFVNNVMGAAFPIGAAIAIVLGAIYAGSEFSWGTLKTTFTQRPGRLSVWTGRAVMFIFWMGMLAMVLFAAGAVMSVVVASFQGHAITWPAIGDISKGFGAIWLAFTVEGAIGLALGVLIRQSAAALGAGLIYILAVELIAVRFIDTINNGAYQWIGNLFVGQNVNALSQSFTSAAFGRTVAPTISAEQAVLVLVAYGVGLMIVAAGFLRQRDVT